MDIDCHWSGFVHNAKVFSNSKTNEEFQNGLMPTTFYCPVSGQEKIRNYLLGILVISYCHLEKNLVRMQIKRNKAEEEKLKNIPGQGYSYNNGKGEHLLLVLTAYIHENLPYDLV